MLQRTLIGAAACTLLVGAISYYNHVRLRPYDLEEYLLNQVEASAPHSHHALQKQPATQQRRGVRKDLWITQPDGSRSHLCLESETSTLTLSERNGKIEAEEILYHLKAECAEEDLRRFTASSGVYSYPSHRFFARNAHLELFRPNNTSLQGIADEVTFSADDPLKTELTLDGHVRCEGQNGLRLFGEHARYSAAEQKQGDLQVYPDARLEWERGSLLCDGPLFLHSQKCLVATEHPLHYRDELVQLDAQTGRLAYQQESKSFHPQELYCEGQIRVVSEQNYAIADQIIYLPSTKTLHLFAESPSRVLFWKADGSIQISAPEVVVVLDSEREEVLGKGDVHFIFDLEEENKIENLFGKYL